MAQVGGWTLSKMIFESLHLRRGRRVPACETRPMLSCHTSNHHSKNIRRITHLRWNFKNENDTKNCCERAEKGGKQGRKMMGGTRIFCSDRLGVAALGKVLKESIRCSISSQSILCDEIMIVHVDSHCNTQKLATYWTLGQLLLPFV